MKNFKILDATGCVRVVVRERILQSMDTACILEGIYEKYKVMRLISAVSIA